MKRFLQIVSLFASAFLLAGCYVPDKFTLDMNLSADGRFAMRYEGEFISLQFLAKIGQGELQCSEIDEAVSLYERDLVRGRDGFKEVSYLGQARYKVRYEKSADLRRYKQFSFPHRQGKVVALRTWTPDSFGRYLEKLSATGLIGPEGLQGLIDAGFNQQPHIIEVFGDKAPQEVREELMAKGFDITGRVRVWTDARVGYHNATRVVEGSPTLYEWDIQSMADPTPRMFVAHTP